MAAMNYYKTDDMIADMFTKVHNQFIIWFSKLREVTAANTVNNSPASEECWRITLSKLFRSSEYELLANFLEVANMDS